MENRAQGPITIYKAYYKCNQPMANKKSSAIYAAETMCLITREEIKREREIIKKIYGSKQKMKENKENS